MKKRTYAMLQVSPRRWSVIRLESESRDTLRGGLRRELWMIEAGPMDYAKAYWKYVELVDKLPEDRKAAHYIQFGAPVGD